MGRRKVVVVGWNWHLTFIPLFQLDIKISQYKLATLG